MLDPRRQALAELRNAHQKVLSLRRASFPPIRGITASRQAINALLEANFRTAGFELDKYRALINQTNAEAREMMVQLDAENDKQAPAMHAYLHDVVDDWSSNIAHLKALDSPADPVIILLDTPIEISATSGIALASTHIGPKFEYNWAQFTFDRGPEDHGNGTEEVIFTFPWQNPHDKYVVINAFGIITFNGACTVLSNGGFLPLERFSLLAVDANFYVNQLWTDPVTSPINQSGQNSRALVLGCDSSGFIAAGDIDGDNLFRGLSVDYTSLVIPPQATVMYNVACTLHYTHWDGEVHCLFRDGGREVMCPGVSLNILS